MKFPVMRFEQPAGAFYLTVMPADYVLAVSSADPRHYDPERFATLGGVQRSLSDSRARDIAEYCRTPDAAFPTAIVLAVQEEHYRLSPGRDVVEFLGHGRFANIVDGQHRLKGLERSEVAKSFDLPVVLLLDSTLEEQALLFATINGKQTKVGASLIYDLFGLTESRSPQRTAHEVARAMNATPTSPWHRRLKMLGRKSFDGSLETVTQGTFVRELLQHISPNPARDFAAARANEPFQKDDSRVFNRYFIAGEDDTIVRILTNLFEAQRSVWREEWEEPERFILTKSTGFMATMWTLDSVISTGQKKKTLTKDFLVSIFGRASDRLSHDGKKLISDDFPSSSAGIRLLGKYFSDAAKADGG